MESGPGFLTLQAGEFSTITKFTRCTSTVWRRRFSGTRSSTEFSKPEVRSFEVSIGFWVRIQLGKLMLVPDLHLSIRSQVRKGGAAHQELESFAGCSKLNARY